MNQNPSFFNRPRLIELKYAFTLTNEANYSRKQSQNPLCQSKVTEQTNVGLVRPDLPITSVAGHGLDFCFKHHLCFSGYHGDASQLAFASPCEGPEFLTRWVHIREACQFKNMIIYTILVQKDIPFLIWSKAFCLCNNNPVCARPKLSEMTFRKRVLQALAQLFFLLCPLINVLVHTTGATINEEAPSEFYQTLSLRVWRWKLPTSRSTFCKNTDPFCFHSKSKSRR